MTNDQYIARVQEMVADAIRLDNFPRQRILNAYEAHARLSNQATKLWGVLLLPPGPLQTETLRHELIRTLILSCVCLIDLDLVRAKTEKGGPADA